MDKGDPSLREECFRARANTEYHAGGAAAPGQVADEHLEFFRVRGLGTVDATLIVDMDLVKLQAAPVYAIADKAADIIKSDQ